MSKKSLMENIIFCAFFSTFLKIVNCCIFLTSYRKYLNDKFYRNEFTVPLWRLSFISPERVNIIAKPWMFFLILLSFVSLYRISPWCNQSLQILLDEPFLPFLPFWLKFKNSRDSAYQSKYQSMREKILSTNQWDRMASSTYIIEHVLVLTQLFL